MCDAPVSARLCPLLYLMLAHECGLCVCVYCGASCVAALQSRSHHGEALYSRQYSTTALSVPCDSQDP